MSPRTPRQFEEIRESSRKKIMDASLELFGTVGYEATSMAVIAKKAGISKGLIYNYFESKEDLLKGLIEELTSIGEALMADMLTDDPKKTLENIFRLTFKWLREHEKLNRLIFSLILQVDRFDFIHQMANAKMKEYVVLLEELLKAMNFPDYRAEARIIATLFDGIGIQYIVLKKDYPLDEIESILINKYCV